MKSGAGEAGEEVGEDGLLEGQPVDDRGGAPGAAVGKGFVSGLGLDFGLVGLGLG